MSLSQNRRPFVALLFAILLLASCRSEPAADGTGAAPTPAFLAATTAAAPTLPPENDAGASPADTPVAGNVIDVATGDGRPVDRRLLGTNVPAWLGTGRLNDPLFQDRTRAAGVTLVRIPGGSWSNYYDWLACEQGGAGIDDDAECFWPWAARPSDFIRFAGAVDRELMYTINANGTAQEAAALVAFLNGDIADETAIGSDLRGRDWGTVGQWARLRQDHGHPAPVDVRYWEIGNEIYGGKPGQGQDCTDFGWEDVWTCDGAEYINGIAGWDGFRAYSAAMKGVDPTILVGAVGAFTQDEWSDWGNEVLAAGGDTIDFYVIHQYGYFNPPPGYAEMLALPQALWPALMADYRRALDRHAGGRPIPVAVTEYNLLSVQDLDEDQLMTRAGSALYVADTIGQMMVSGVSIANHWNLANGQAANGTDYGLVDAESFARNPQYFAFRLWSGFGDELLPVRSPFSAADTLSVYAGRTAAGAYTLLAINKTGEPLSTMLRLDGERFTAGSAQIMAAATLDAQDVTFNGVADPAVDFADAPPLPLADADRFAFPAYSITLLVLEP